MESRQFRLKRLRTQVRLFLPLLFLFIALGLLIFGQFENPTFRRFQISLMQGISPIVSGVSAPLRWGDKGVEEARLFLKTYQENNVLRAKNEALQNWRNIAIQLGLELQELKMLLNYVPPKSFSSLTARVLSDDGSRFVRSLVVEAGLEQGVSKGDVAMTPNGVFGRVVEVGSSYSRLMLLTDYLSRVPVSVGRDKIPCILIGDNSATPKLVSLPDGAVVKAGDVVMTSGKVGVYPSGLGIGVVSPSENGDITVSLYEENQTPTFVRLVNFGLNNVLLPDTCMTGDK